MTEKVFTWVFPVDNTQKLLWKKEITDAYFLHAYFYFFIFFYFLSALNLNFDVNTCLPRVISGEI